jgi:hypothetical protein
MTRQTISTLMSRGRELTPSPAPHPQKQHQVVYTKYLTHPFRAINSCLLPGYHLLQESPPTRPLGSRVARFLLAFGR